VAQNFLRCDREQELLLPPSLREWLSEDHLAWFVLDAVDEIDLSAFCGAYREDGWGRAAFEPAMMVALLLYGYAVGERSSRAIERRCREDVAFRVITGNRIPDHATIARFRVRHEQALAATFTQVLALCGRPGWRPDDARDTRARSADDALERLVGPRFDFLIALLSERVHDRPRPHNASRLPKPIKPIPLTMSTNLSRRSPARLRMSATAVENPPYQVRVPSVTPRSRATAAAVDLVACAGAAAGNDTVQRAIVNGFSAVAATAVRNAREGATTSSADSSPKRARQPSHSVLAPTTTRIAALTSPSHKRRPTVQ
jgi:transposase